MNKVLCLLVLFIFVLGASAQIPSGYIASYHLDNSATDYSGNNYNGTLSSTSATANRFSQAGSATAFTSGSSTGTLPSALATALQNDFSIGYWFKTTMTASTSSQWYGGNALVDAEVCGATNDWGTALIDGGKVAMGIGNPDLTIKSTSLYNDGNWHFVTAVRNETAGSIILYVDGSQVATTTGTNTGSLSAPTLVGLGRNVCAATGVFTGSLDDLIAYNRVLTPTEVSDLYTTLSAVTLPLHWVSFDVKKTSGGARLDWQVAEAVNNDHFEVEHSPDGVSFVSVGSVAACEGKVFYGYDYALSGAGVHYFRVKQVDKDGAYTYSPTLRMKTSALSAGPRLLTDPVEGQLLMENPCAEPLGLTIFDASGKIWKRYTILPGRLSLNLAPLPKGYYFYRAVTRGGVAYSGGFVNR